MRIITRIAAASCALGLSALAVGCSADGDRVSSTRTQAEHNQAYNSKRSADGRSTWGTYDYGVGGVVVGSTDVGYRRFDSKRAPDTIVGGGVFGSSSGSLGAVDDAATVKDRFDSKRADDLGYAAADRASDEDQPASRPVIVPDDGPVNDY
jgi:hypothetical protein